MIKFKVHHIGYAVKDIRKSIEIFESIGFYEDKPPIQDEKRNVSIAFLTKDGYRIELISSNSVDSGMPSPIDSLLKKIGPTPYHFCYEVDDFSRQLKELMQDGWIVVKMPEEAIAINNQKVAFLFNKTVGLIEILEKRE